LILLTKTIVFLGIAMQPIDPFPTKINGYHELI